MKEDALYRRRIIIATLLYAALIAALWFGFHGSAQAVPLTEFFPRAFACFAVLLAPLWFLGFDAAEPLKRLPQWLQIALAGLLALPYFIFAAGTISFRWQPAVTMIAFPVLLAAFLGPRKTSERIHWRDAAALSVIVAFYYLKLSQPAWRLVGYNTQFNVTFFAKLFLADVALYCFLVIRKIDGAGYSLIPTRSAVIVGIREWLFYVPLAIGVGEVTGFIHFHAAAINPKSAVASVALTFLLVATPEELFFRSILQNLLETRFGRIRALVIAAILFGLSHFNHGSRFNWRYVLLASIAGLFYGRAWRAHRQIFAAIVTHTAVDVVWSFWFRR